MGEERCDPLNECNSDVAENGWGEVFAAYTLSKLKPSGRGRVGYTVGGSGTYYPGYAPIPKFYTAVDMDARHDLKILFEVYYDPYLPDMNYRIGTNRYTDSKFSFDFGFIYAYNENVRFGLHYQPYFAALYVKL